MLFVYRFLINLILIFSPIIVIVRILKKKENIYRVKEKFGLNSIKRKKGKLIWFHGASVGELQSIVPVLEKLEKSKKISQILITSNTLSSSKIISNFKFNKVIHQFFPIDNNEIVKKFINYWKPSATFFIDSEIWPNVIFNLKLNKIPTILINGRITENSFKRWMKFENFSKSIFSNLTVCLSSNKKTVYYLKKLGAKNIKYSGNLKYAQSENENVILEKNITDFFKKRIVWCASSTHNTEEKFIGNLHNQLKKKFKNLITIIIPRHIDRDEKIKKELNELGLKVHLHEPKTLIKYDTDIYLVNSYGKTKSFYSIVNNVFLGGSLIEHGGQNPLEAVRYNCNILHGPHVSNFKEIYSFLNSQKISKQVKNLNQTKKLLEKLLSSKKNKKNIRDKVNVIGQRILKHNMNEIQIILNNI